MSGGSARKNHPMWAWKMPRSVAERPWPWVLGECGSSSWSLCWWWRRWVATQRRTGPSVALEPRMVGVGGVRVVFVVAVLVVSTVGGDPAEDGALDGHRAEDGEDRGDDGAGAEGLVREEAVVADGDSDGREEVGADEEAEVEPVEAD